MNLLDKEKYEQWEHELRMDLRKNYNLVPDENNWPRLTFIGMFKRGITPDYANMLYFTGRICL
jgi:hypothetical protein